MKKIILSNIKIPVMDSYNKGLEVCVKENINSTFRDSECSFSSIYKKSIDARKKDKVFYVVSAVVDAHDTLDLGLYKNAMEYKEYKLEEIETGKKKMDNRPIIVGSGPCGLFAGLLLSEYGYNPIIVERGDNVENRSKKVTDFWENNNLDSESNVQFGEGGAGTFSDGKLVTRIKDKRAKYVFESFVKFGAPSEIKYESKPHIGTDNLVEVVKNMREYIIEKGGEFQFNSKVSDLIIKNDKVCGVRINDEYDIVSDVVILAIGHSARDTYEMLFDKGVDMIQKAFSMGLRIEHLQERVNFAQYGNSYKYIDEAAEYFLSAKHNNRMAYSFCMCPGGVVINAASEENKIVTNGMSYSKRDGKNANSAWVVGIKESDFDSKHPLSGMKLQDELEKRSFALGGSNYSAPVQLLGDFLVDKPSVECKRTKPSFSNGVKYTNLNGQMPKYITDTLKNTALLFKNRMKCFTDYDALLTGFETRTSSPVRITRNDMFVSTNIEGLYPGGEGAGYSGGITSSCIDGLKIAQAIIEEYKF